MVGVAKTTKYWLIGEEPRPHVYLPMSQNPGEFMATLLVPLFLPENIRIDNVLRAMAGV